MRPRSNKGFVSLDRKIGSVEAGKPAGWAVGRLGGLG